MKRSKCDLADSPGDHTPNTRRQSARFRPRIETPNRVEGPEAKRPHLESAEHS